MTTKLERAQAKRRREIAAVLGEQLLVWSEGGAPFSLGNITDEAQWGLVEIEQMQEDQ